MPAALGPRIRLAALTCAVVLAWVGFWVLRPFSKEDVQAWIEPLGAVAAPAYVAAAVVLALVLVPGALLAAAAGLLFGALGGAALSLVAAVITGVLGLLIARRVGAAGLDAVDRPRVQALAAAVRRNGLWAVVAQRLAPGVPDGPANYAAGLVRIRARDMALGTLIGAAPRGLSYALIGDSVDDPLSRQGLFGLGLLALTGIAGLWALRHGLVRGRAAPE